MDTKSIITSIPKRELVEAISLEVLQGVKQLLQQNQKEALQAKEHLTRKETAQLLNISLVTLHEWTNRGILSKLKIGSKVLYRREEVLQALTRIESRKA